MNKITDEEIEQTLERITKDIRSGIKEVLSEVLGLPKQKAKAVRIGRINGRKKADIADGERYWTVGNDASVLTLTFTNSVSDNRCVLMGNAFYDEKSAEVYRDYQLVLTKLQVKYGNSGFIFVPSNWTNHRTYDYFRNSVGYNISYVSCYTDTDVQAFIKKEFNSRELDAVRKYMRMS